jgi:hypothetical protein
MGEGVTTKEPIVVLPARGSEPPIVMHPPEDAETGGDDYQKTGLFILGIAQVATILILGFILISQQANSRKNRDTIQSLCATTTAIRNLDKFFLSIIPAKPPAGETAKARETRVAFVKLVKADVARMAAAGDTCKRL